MINDSSVNAVIFGTRMGLNYELFFHEISKKPIFVFSLKDQVDLVVVSLSKV